MERDIVKEHINGLINLFIKVTGIKGESKGRESIIIKMVVYIKVNL